MTETEPYSWPEFLLRCAVFFVVLLTLAAAVAFVLVAGCVVRVVYSWVAEP